MSGRILILDPIATNRIVLKVKLASAFYSCDQAASIAEAVDVARKSPPDAVIMDSEMAEGGVAELRAALTNIPGPKPLPVLVLTPRDCTTARAAAMRQGANDAASKPLNDIELMARIRALLRARSVVEEFSIPQTDDSLGWPQPVKTDALPAGLAETPSPFTRPLRVTLVTDRMTQVMGWRRDLGPLGPFDCCVCSPVTALASPTVAAPAPDAYVIDFTGRDLVETAHRLALITELNSRALTRNVPILIVASKEAADLAATGLDIGARDIMTGGFHGAEVAIRIKNLISQQAREDAMRRSLQARLDEALIDPLTGLYNRRFAAPCLVRTRQHALNDGQDFAVLALDLDHFKQVNDDFGHAAGDSVLVGVSKVLQTCLRPDDVAARIGGEEFLVILPATNAAEAHQIAERIRQTVKATPFKVAATDAGISISLSAGLAVARAGQRGHDILERADAALYRAKAGGRNQVVLAHTAALTCAS